MSAPDEDDDVYYDDGPYCEHWEETWRCEEVCKTCGHPCRFHAGEADYPGRPGPCENGPKCDCLKFEDITAP